MEWEGPRPRLKEQHHVGLGWRHGNLTRDPEAKSTAGNPGEEIWKQSKEVGYWGLCRVREAAGGREGCTEAFLFQWEGPINSWAVYSHAANQNKLLQTRGCEMPQGPTLHTV